MTEMSAKRNDIVALFDQLLDALRAQGVEHLTAVELNRLVEKLSLPVVEVNRRVETPGGFQLLRTLTRAQLLQLLGVAGVSVLVQAECRRLLAEESDGDVH
jgi:hypothetical protein